MERTDITFRVALVGAESTGKSTLARKLSEQLSAPWVREFAREYAARVARPLVTDDVEEIARGQLLMEDEALRSKPPLLLLDTDLVSTLVYARHYYGTFPEWVRAAAKSRLSDVYLLLGTDIPFTPDPVRDAAEARDAIQALFRAELGALNATVVEIAGQPNERLRSALAAIKHYRPDLVV